jgi:hypothetical protein
MLKSGLWTALIVLAMSIGVVAANDHGNDHTCQGNANCSTSPSTTNDNTAINTNVATGGSAQGGNAQGGTGIGIGGSGGQGGSVRDSGNSASISGVTNSGNSDNRNTNTNVANGGQGGQGGKGGSASSFSGSSSNSGGNKTVVNANQYEPHQAPAVSAPMAYPSAPCRVSGSAGASWLTGGVSLGTSKMDNECDKRETARSFKELGLGVEACQILMTTKAAKKAGLKTPAVCKQ